MSNEQHDGNTVHVGFVGDLHITTEQSDAIADQYNVLHSGFMDHHARHCAVHAMDQMAAALGLRFEPMTTPDEGYYLAGPREPAP